MTKRTHGTNAIRDRGMKHGTPIQNTRMDEPDAIQERRPYTHGGTVTDPNERMVKPTNTSRSYARGVGVMRHVERSLAEHAMDVEGGGKPRR